MRLSRRLGAVCAFILSVISIAPQAALVDLGAGLVYDTVLDITWSQPDIGRDWDEANTWAAGLTLGGVSGWRQPSGGEFFALYQNLGGNYPGPVPLPQPLFPGLQGVFPSEYWTGDERDANVAFTFAFFSGNTQIGVKFLDNFTWAVVPGKVPVYSVGGIVSGLSGSVTLQINGGDDLTLNADGTYAFATELADGASYAVTVLTQPATQTCTVSNGSGTLAGADVTNVDVTCVTNTYTVGGLLSGLVPGDTVVLQNNGTDDLTLTADGAFTFPTPLDDGTAYAVTVLTQPSAPSETCTVTNASGTLSGADVNNVSVTCTVDTFTVGGTLSGLAAGATVVLQNNGADDLTLSADGPFTFSAPLADGTDYAVTVLTQPDGPDQTCTVSNGSGTLAGADVVDVAVVCTDVVTARAVPAVSAHGLALTGLGLALVGFNGMRRRVRRKTAAEQSRE
jgi:hypothetical protein